MKMKRLTLLLLIVVALAGCGGPSFPPDSPGRGEGDIPLGRIRGGGRVKIAIQEANNTISVYSVMSSEDVSTPFYTEPVLDGATVLTFIPEDSQISSQSYNIQLGETQRFVINVSLPPAGRSFQVTGLHIAPLNSNQVRVGTSLRLNITVQGTNVQGISPTVWVDGGIGSLNGANVFTAVSPGEGSIKAEIMGYRAEIPITVIP